jgi:pimeloyl-ACP methyl ester carboxylesterase
MLLFIIFLVLLVLFIVSVTIVLFIVGPTLLLQPRRRLEPFYQKVGQPLSPTELQLSFEEIILPTEDGLRLSAWLIKAPDPPQGTIIYLHGVADCKIDGLRFAKLMHGHRFNIFLYDSRRHGYSEGNHCTYGYFEKYDVRNAINYLSNRNDLRLGKIGIFGTSMGAAIALQAAALDNRIAAVIAENSFTTLRTIFDDYQKRRIKVPFHYLRNLVIIRSEINAQFKASAVSPLESVEKIHVPVLFVYSTADHLIKHSYSQQLFDHANEPKEYFPIEGATHGNTWQIAGKAYEEKIVNFYSTNLR